MQAMILAAGMGTRLRPLTSVCPKPMLPVAGRPLLEHTIDWLYRYGVRDAVVNLHHLPRVIADGLGGGGRFGVRLTYSYEEQLLGTAGALRLVRDHLHETFVLVHGDTLVDIDLAGMLSFHRRRGALVTLALKRVATPQQQTLVAVDRAGRVLELSSQPGVWGGGLGLGGVAIIEPALLESIPADNPCDLARDLLPLLLEQGAPIYGQETWGYLLDINSHAAYARALEDWSLNERAVGL